MQLALNPETAQRADFDYGMLGAAFFSFEAAGIRGPEEHPGNLVGLS